MYLSQTAEYALRTMTLIARREGDGFVRAKDLSEAAGVPAAYLSKILRRLVAAELLRSRKGHGGGFRLARPARSIRFIDILRAADAEPDPDHCIFGWEGCGEGDPCPLHPLWGRFREAAQEWAEEHTLADALSGADPLTPSGPR